MSRPLFLMSQYRPHPPSGKAVNPGKCAFVCMLEIPKPAPERWSEILNHPGKTDTLPPSGFPNDLLFQRPKTLLPNIALSSLKPVSKEFKPLSLFKAVAHVGLVRVQRQPITVKDSNARNSGPNRSGKENQTPEILLSSQSHASTFQNEGHVGSYPSCGHSRAFDFTIGRCDCKRCNTCKTRKKIPEKPTTWCRNKVPASL